MQCARSVPPPLCRASGCSGGPGYPRSEYEGCSGQRGNGADALCKKKERQAHMAGNEECHREKYRTDVGIQKFQEKGGTTWIRIVSG